MKATSKKQSGVAIPPPLLAEVTAVAKRQGRPAAAVVRVALTQYLAREKDWKQTLVYGRKKATAQGIRSERGISRAIEEYRRGTASLSGRLGMSPARLKSLLREEVRAHRDHDIEEVEEWAAVDAETWPSDDRDS